MRRGTSGVVVVAHRAWTTCRRKERCSSGRTKIQANQFVFASGVKKSIGERRIGADRERQNLRLSAWLKARRAGRSANQLPLLRQDQQLIPGQQDCPGAKAVLTPADFPGPQFDAAQV